MLGAGWAHEYQGQAWPPDSGCAQKDEALSSIVVIAYFFLFWINLALVGFCIFRVSREYEVLFWYLLEQKATDFSKLISVLKLAGFGRYKQKIQLRGEVLTGGKKD